MSFIKSPLELYKYLPQTNCKQCMFQTCLAFAVAVIKSEKDLSVCPFLDKATTISLQARLPKKVTLVEDQMELLGELKKEFASLDMGSVQQRLGLPLRDGKLQLNCLGKEFFLDSKGNVTSVCHATPWLDIPLLHYAIQSSGKDIAKSWVHFRELENGISRTPLFIQRCEKPLQQLADQYTDLFKDIVEMFSGETLTPCFDADISLTLEPFPKLPVLICYWLPDGDMESDLSIYFDKTAEENLPIDSIHMLMVGMVRMFEKISLHHRSLNQ